MAAQQLFQTLKSGTFFVPIPPNLRGLEHVARLCEELSQTCFAQCFWNMPTREKMTDSLYISQVLAQLKAYGGMRGVRKALEIIEHLEKLNAH